MSQDDLVSTMQYFGLVKYWKGKHIVLKNKVGWEMYYVHTYSICTMYICNVRIYALYCMCVVHIDFTV